jgi:hypothetical protein
MKNIMLVVMMVMFSINVNAGVPKVKVGDVIVYDRSYTHQSDPNDQMDESWRRFDGLDVVWRSTSTITAIDKNFIFFEMRTERNDIVNRDIEISNMYAEIDCKKHLYRSRFTANDDWSDWVMTLSEGVKETTYHYFGTQMCK